MSFKELVKKALDTLDDNVKMDGWDYLKYHSLNDGKQKLAEELTRDLVKAIAKELNQTEGGWGGSGRRGAV